MVRAEKAKAALSGRTAGRGVGTPVAEYSEQGPFHCANCEYLEKRGVPDKAHGLCNEPHVGRDKKVKLDAKTGLKIVHMERGCCRFVEPEETNRSSER